MGGDWFFTHYKIDCDMKKFIFTGATLLLLLAVASCQTSQSAYKKAYDRAQQQQQGTTTTQTTTESRVVVKPVQTRPAVMEETVQAPVNNNVNYDSAPVRRESVNVVSGSGLKKYSLVCGSFGMKSNAENLKRFLDGQGYNAIIVHNDDAGLYRVVATSFDTHEQASAARRNFMNKYPNREDFQGAWLLYRVY